MSSSAHDRFAAFAPQPSRRRARVFAALALAMICFTRLGSPVYASTDELFRIAPDGSPGADASWGAIGLQHTTNGVAISNGTGDSQRQDGDSFATEATYNIRFVGTVATANADAGTTLPRAVARDNKHKVRFWGRAVVLSSEGRDPGHRDGAGNRA